MGDGAKVERCDVCGFRRRGQNHDEGPHHLVHAHRTGVEKRKAVAPNGQRSNWKHPEDLR